MADHFGEPDPRKISSLPADILIHWQAYFKLKSSKTTPHKRLANTIEQQCADVVSKLM